MIFNTWWRGQGHEFVMLDTGRFVNKSAVSDKRILISDNF